MKQIIITKLLSFKVSIWIHRFSVAQTPHLKASKAQKSTALLSSFRTWPAGLRRNYFFSCWRVLLKNANAHEILWEGSFIYFVSFFFWLWAVTDKLFERWKWTSGQWMLKVLKKENFSFDVCLLFVNKNIFKCLLMYLNFPSHLMPFSF